MILGTTGNSSRVLGSVGKHGCSGDKKDKIPRIAACVI